MTNQASEADKAIMIGFLYGIQSDLLPADEVRHRMAGFRHTQGYKEAIELIRTEKLKLLAEVREEAFNGGLSFELDDGQIVIEVETDLKSITTKLEAEL